MKQTATLVIDRKENIEGSYTIQAVVWKLPTPLPGSPHRYKYRLFFGKADRSLIRFDNERGKGDHIHFGDREEPYAFLDIATLLQDFKVEIDRALATERGKDAK